MRILNGSISFDDAAHSAYAGHAPRPSRGGVSLTQQLNVSRRHLEARFTHLPDPYSCCMLFFTVAAPGHESSAFFVRRSTLEAAWREGATRVRQWAWVRKQESLELRIDWPHEIVPIEGHDFHRRMWESHQDFTWALADEDLENAEIIPPVWFRGDNQRASGGGGITFARSAFIQARTSDASSYLLMQMRGVHTNRQGMQTALPRVHAPLFGETVSNSSWLPYLATLNMLCGEQRLEGNWEDAADVCDHLALTYALLLSRAHIKVTDPVRGKLKDAIRRAISYALQNMSTLLAKAIDMPFAQAMYVLVFARYLEGLDSRGDGSAAMRAVEQIAESLSAVEGPMTSVAQDWLELARQAWWPVREPAGENLLASLPAGARASESPWMLALQESFLMSLSTGLHRGAAGRGICSGGERWLSIAIAESLYVKPYPEEWRDRSRRSGTHLKAFIAVSRKRIVWPEMALFLPAGIRDKAAFASIGLEGRELVVDGGTAARLLINCFAADELLRTS